MWVIISTSSSLKFYNFKNKGFFAYTNLQYTKDQFGNDRHIDNHNAFVSELITVGIPLFVNKADARKSAVKENLTGFKYLKLSPSVIKVPYSF